MDNILPPYLQLTKEEQKATLEAIIFASEEVVSVDYLYKTLITDDFFDNKSNVDDNEWNDLQISLTDEKNRHLNFKKTDFIDLIVEINQELLRTNRPFQILHVGGGYQYATRKEYGSLVNSLIKSKQKRRLSQAALETLAIIAYRQPISKPEIEKIRGVNSNEIVNSLIEKNFVKMAGRKEDALGKPVVYATTDEFLKIFGINSLEELPKLREIEEIHDFDSADTQTIEISVTENDIEKTQLLAEKLTGSNQTDNNQINNIQADSNFQTDNNQKSNFQTDSNQINNNDSDEIISSDDDFLENNLSDNDSDSSFLSPDNKEHTDEHDDENTDTQDTVSADNTNNQLPNIQDEIGKGYDILSND